MPDPSVVEWPLRLVAEPRPPVILVSGALTALAYPLFWQGGTAEKAVVRVDGAVVAEMPLTTRKRIEVQGAIGPTVIEIEPGRARKELKPGWTRN